jgi:hypothetical protein
MLIMMMMKMIIIVIIITKTCLASTIFSNAEYVEYTRFHCDYLKVDTKVDFCCT